MADSTTLASASRQLGLPGWALLGWVLLLLCGALT